MKIFLGTTVLETQILLESKKIILRNPQQKLMVE